MSAHFIINQAEEKDVPTLLRLLQDLFTLESDFIPDIEKQERGLRMLLKNKRTSIILVARMDDKVVGMCTAQILISTAEGGNTLRIEDVVVKEESRGMGIGTALLEAVQRWANQQEVKRLELLVDCNNTPAVDFYNKNQWISTQLFCLHKKDIC